MGNEGRESRMAEQVRLGVWVLILHKDALKLLFNGFFSLGEAY